MRLFLARPPYELKAMCLSLRNKVLSKKHPCGHAGRKGVVSCKYSEFFIDNKAFTRFCA